MSVHLRRTVSGATAVVGVGGEIDVDTADAVRTELAEVLAGGATRVVVDLTDTEFLDSSALGVLVGLNKDVAGLGGSLSIVCPRPGLRKIFTITRLVEVLDVVDTLADAGVAGAAGVAGPADVAGAADVASAGD